MSERMLTQQLWDLEDDGIVHRKVYAELPPKVDYPIIEYDRTLRLITKAVGWWGRRHMRRIDAKRVRRGGKVTSRA